MTREQPRQNPPPVQRLRVRYAKRGRLRFTSHRDVSRAVERAVVRAALPVAYSSGFNPHPRLSYAGAAPTGAASEAEYLEIALAQRCDPDDVRRRLDQTLPDGLDIVEVVETAAGALPERLQASRWRIVVDRPVAEVAAAVDAFLAASAVPVERMTKKGLRDFDARGPVLALSAAPEEADPGPGTTGPTARTVLDLVVRHAEPAVRPDDVLRGLAVAGGLELGAEAGGAPLLTRLRQGPLDPETGEVLDP